MGAVKTDHGKIKAALLWNIVFGLTMLVYIAGLFIPIMEPDAAVYAQVSMEMHDRGDYLSIYHKGASWLDKPHFPFWMSAFSYEIFGVSAFAYKLPAILFILLGALYTYLFGKRYYSPLHGWLAVILLITAEHTIISNQDVRAEPFMTGLMIMGLYHLTALVGRRGGGEGSRRAMGSGGEAMGSGGAAMGSRQYAVDGGGAVMGSRQNYAVGIGRDAMGSEQQAVGTGQWVGESGSGAVGLKAKRNPAIHFILGSLALACLIMTKGLFTIIPIASGIGFALIYEKRWNEIFHWRWLVVLVLMVLFMSPALYGYYQQFDKHPEQVVFGETNVSGVKFFLWTSQWGRFTNTGPIKGKGDISFFVHTMLWAFLPWAFAAFFALWNKAKHLIKRLSFGENYTFFGFITLFLIFSFSRFQLSFYLNPLFPLISILTVSILLNQSKRVLRIFSVMHLVLCLLLIVGLVLLHFAFMDRLPHIDSILIVVAGIFLGLFLYVKERGYLKKIVFATAIVVLSVNYYVNRDFYPALMEYQAESVAAEYFMDHKIPASDVLFVGEMESVADVIMHQPTKVVSYDDVVGSDIAGKYVFTSPEGRAKINALGLQYAIVTEFEDFPVTRLTGKFINKSTRLSEVQTKYLLKISDPDNDKPAVDVTRK